MLKRWWLFPFILMAIVPLLGLGFLLFAAVIAYPRLPSLEVLTDYKPKIPLRVFTADGVQIGEFGEERRQVVKIQEVPPLMKQAILAAEDDRFYQHHGIDYSGVARAALSNVTSGGKKEGASTITMQVARNFFLSSEKTLSRKLNEILLSFKIENNLTKDQILELYMNQIYLGQRAYGFGSAAQIYFGKDLKQLTVAEMAMLAGLPKAPSRYNPVVNPKRAQLRQWYVLRRMRDLNFITDEQLEKGKEQRLVVVNNLRGFSNHADYVAEMVRAYMHQQYQEAAYTSGYRVYTTLDSSHQQAAYEALRRGVMDSDRRRGYRGAEKWVTLPKAGDKPEEVLEDALQEIPDSDELQAAIVLSASMREVKAFKRGGDVISISGEGLKFAQRALSDTFPEKQRLRPGAVIRVVQDVKGRWSISQMPSVEAAFVSVEPDSGAVKALVGGFEFQKNNFNHVTQAWRQPGSSFKPFIYSAALEKGFTPASIVEDSPLYLGSDVTGGAPWQPKNFDGSFSGPIRVRTALTKSKNLVSIRLLQAITPQYAQDYASKFGFDPAKHPPYLTMALGAGSVTPLQMATAYSVFANGGYRIRPYYIDRIEDVRGKIVARTQLPPAGNGAEQAIDPRNAYLMTNMMRDVVRFGTAVRAMKLGRADLAGKTGTTNDQIDAWFAGYQRHLVAVAWIGFDQPKAMGTYETGGHAALPIWVDYMAVALKGQPEAWPEPPAGVVQATINPYSGRRSNGEGSVVEYFYAENLSPNGGGGGNSDTGSDGTEGENNPAEKVEPNVEEHVLGNGY